MKTEVKVIKTKDFIRTKSSGELNLEATKEVLKELSELKTPGEVHEMLVDIRDTISVLTISDIFEMVSEVASKYRFSFRKKIAILIGPQHDMDKARFLEMCARNRGFIVNVFDDFESAVTWLMHDDE
ncbi:MAG: hypothetical protein N2510_06670 [Ignavibacteria bacterium]|nr:hypothetical protein [Ignavibacteria bacterium]